MLQYKNHGCILFILNLYLSAMNLNGHVQKGFDFCSIGSS